MPDFLRIASVEPALEAIPETERSAIEEHYPDPSDEYLTWSDLQNALAAIATAAPNLAMRVVYVAGLDWFDLRAAGIRDGSIWYESFTLSSETDHYVEAPTKFAPDLEIALDVAGDRLVDLVSLGADELEDCTAKRKTLRLPLRYSAPLDALAVVAGHLANESESFIVVVEGAHYAAELRRGKDVTLRGLEVWHSDPELRAAGRLAVESPRSGIFTRPATRAPEIVAWDPKRPLVTGSAQSRNTAAMEMMPWFQRSEYGWGVDRSIKPTSPELMASLVAAASADENRGLEFASVRTTLYGYICDFVAIEAGRALIAFLDQETDPEMRFTLYTLIATRRGKNPGRVLVKAYREEKDLRPKLGELLWKHAAAVEILVREELVPKWGSDPAYAKGIVKLLRREFIPVPRAWLEGANDEIQSALAELVRRAESIQEISD